MSPEAGRKGTSRRRRGGRSRRGSYLIAIGIAVALAAPLIIFLLTQNQLGDDDGGGFQLVVPSPRPAELQGQRHVLGDPDAPVTLLEYADFQCPFCGQAARAVLPAVEEEFVPSGELRVELRPIAFLGDESNLAAEAAECAADQGRFWDYHDVLFANQQGENRGAFSMDRLKSFAAALELDTAEFDSCLDAREHAGAVKKATEEALAAGINSVPRIFINGERVNATLNDVRGAIQEELAAAP